MTMIIFHAVVWIQVLDCVYLESKADRSWILRVTTKMAVVNKVQSLREGKMTLELRSVDYITSPADNKLSALGKSFISWSL